MEQAIIEVRMVDGDHVSFSYSTLLAFRNAPDPRAYIESMVEECRRYIQETRRKLEVANA